MKAIAILLLSISMMTLASAEVVDEHARVLFANDKQSPEPHRRLQNCLNSAQGFACELTSFPVSGSYTIFDGCSSSSPSSLTAACDSCAVFVGNDFADVNSPTLPCRSCSVCRNGNTAVISYDCSNVSSGSCAVQSCDGSCSTSSSSFYPRAFLTGLVTLLPVAALLML